MNRYCDTRHRIWGRGGLVKTTSRNTDAATGYKNTENEEEKEKNEQHTGNQEAFIKYADKGFYHENVRETRKPWGKK